MLCFLTYVQSIALHVVLEVISVFRQTYFDVALYDPVVSSFHTIL